MNPLLARLHPYPFERWRELTLQIQHSGGLRPISLGIGEPKHPAPALIETALTGAMTGLSVYPPTVGEPRLREAIVGWLQRRYLRKIDRYLDQVDGLYSVEYACETIARSHARARAAHTDLRPHP